MPSLRANLVKRVERLPKPSSASGALQPLFEAVSNSIHSTQSKYCEAVSKLGKVTVSVITGRRQAPVIITVEDNGVGLDDKNFEAFMMTDTDNKIRVLRCLGWAVTTSGWQPEVKLAGEQIDDSLEVAA
jgi:hypothetical protein